MRNRRRGVTRHRASTFDIFSTLYTIGVGASIFSCLFKRRK